MISLLSKEHGKDGKFQHHQQQGPDHRPRAGPPATRSKEGDRVEFAFVEGSAVLRPVRTTENPITKYVGALAKRTPGGAAVAWVREMREDERSR